MGHSVKNRNKKVATAVLIGALSAVSLSGCGKAAKLPDTVVNTSLVVDKDGRVTSYLVDTFDKDFYNLDGLKEMVQSEADAFNIAHADAPEDPLAVKAVQSVGEGATVQVVEEFTDTKVYEEYTEQELFYGTRVEALADGIGVNLDLVNAEDGTPADQKKLEKALEKNHLLITNASAYIYCPYQVLYVSEGVVMGEDGYVDASQSDGVVTILMKK